VKHPNFDLMHCIYFSRLVVDEFIAKGGENVHKVVELFYQLGGEEKFMENMINSTKGGSLH
jgi:hypothetical protein